MSKIEYFLQRANSWVTLSFSDYLDLLFPQDDKKFSKLKSIKGLPLKYPLTQISNLNDPAVSDISNMNLISGNFVEVLMQKELCLVPDKKRGSLTLENKFNTDNKNKKVYEVWSRAKIISADLEKQIFFLEDNDEELVIVDDLTKIRPLKEVKLNNNKEEEVNVYCIRRISSSEYDQFKKQFDNLEKSLTPSGLLFQKFDQEKSCLRCLIKSSLTCQIPALKDFEERYGINEDMSNRSINSNSEVNSNKNSSRNVPGVTSRSGKSEESTDKNVTEIENARYKETFIYNIKFKRDMEKILGNEIKKNKFSVNKINGNNKEEFKITIYGDIETDFLEEKKEFEKNYKKAEINVEGNVDKNTIKDMANKASVKFFYYDKKIVYLVGEDKSIKIFKKIFNMNMQYVKEIKKAQNESEGFKKDLVKFKKNIKTK